MHEPHPCGFKKLIDYSRMLGAMYCMHVTWSMISALITAQPPFMSMACIQKENHQKPSFLGLFWERGWTAPGRAGRHISANVRIHGCWFSILASNSRTPSEGVECLYASYSQRQTGREPSRVDPIREPSDLHMTIGSNTCSQSMFTKKRLLRRTSRRR